MPCAEQHPEQSKIKALIYVCILKKAIYLFFLKNYKNEKHPALDMVFFIYLVCTYKPNSVPYF